MVETVVELDNLQAGDDVAVDNVASKFYQYAKMSYGADGTINKVTSTATNPLPVALSDIDNAVLDTINTAAEATQAAVEGTLTVGSHAVTNAGTFATQATLQVGTNAIGKLAANSGVDIGDVDVTSIIPLTGATNLGKAIDTAAGATDTGVATLAIRDDSLTTLTPVDGDYVPLRVGSTGALHVTGGGGGTEYTEDVATANPIVGTATVMERDDTIATLTPIEGDWAAFRCSAEGALWTQDFNSDQMRADLTTIAAAVGGTHVDDASFTPATDDGVPIFGMFDDVSPDSIDEGDAGVVRMSSNRNLYETIRDAAGNERGANVTAANELNVLDSNSAAIQTAVETIDNSILAIDAVATGGSVNMAGALRDDSLSALTPVEGDAVPLRVNSTGALHVTGAGGGTQYTLGTDTYTETTSVGTLAGAVRNDTLAALAGTDNEVAPLQVDANGSLYVTGGGGGTEYTVNAAAPADPTGSASLMERDDVLSTLTEVAGDWTNLRATAEGAMWTQDFNSDAILTDTGTIASDTTSIDGKITVCDTGAVVLAAGAASIGTVTANAGTNLNTSALLTTTAHDAAFGTAGTADSQVRTVQGVASMTPLTVDMGANNDVTATLDAETTKVIGTVNVAAAQTIATTNAGTFATQATLQAGTAAFGKLAANSGVDIGDVDVTSIAAGATLIGDVGLQPRTSGGIVASSSGIYRDEDIDETAVALKASAGQIYWIQCTNLDATPIYLHFWNVAQGSVTVGTTLEAATFCIPSQGDANGAGGYFSFPHGIEFGTAITVACTTTIGGTAGPALNEVILNVGYE